jgi:hypothetical protein
VSWCVLYEVLLHPCRGSGQCSGSRIVNCYTDKEVEMLERREGKNRMDDILVTCGVGGNDIVSS